MAITWAQRLKRVFNIDIETCKACDGHLKIIACIRLQGKDCSYNPLHFLHPWRSDAGGTTPRQALFLQCFCISSVRGGQMQEVERSRSQSREQRREQLPSVAVVPTLVTRVKLP